MRHGQRGGGGRFQLGEALRCLAKPGHRPPPGHPTNQQAILKAVFLSKRDSRLGQLARSLVLASKKAHPSRQLKRQCQSEGVLELTGTAQRLAAQPESLIRFSERQLDLSEVPRSCGPWIGR